VVEVGALADLVATKGNTGGCDLPPTLTRVSVGLQFSFFLRHSTSTLRFYASVSRLDLGKA
jgi:hypothetical protein